MVIREVGHASIDMVSQQALVCLPGDVVQDDPLFRWWGDGRQCSLLLRIGSRDFPIGRPVLERARVDQSFVTRCDRAHSLTAWNHSGLSIVRLSARKRSSASRVKTGSAALAADS